MTPPRSDQGGFAMVAAIFLLVVLGLLGGMLLTLGNTQQINAVRDLLGTRAYHAARAGAEWGAYQALMLNSCAASTALPNAVAATGFSVQVNCVASGPHDEAGNMVTLYQITATASTGAPGALDRAERQLQITVSRP